MKTLSLTTWERVALLRPFEKASGNLTELRKLMRVVDVLTLTEKEREVVGWKDQPDGNAMWEKGSHEFAIEFEDADFIVLARIVLGFGDWLLSAGVITVLAKVEALKKGVQE